MVGSRAIAAAFRGGVLVANRGEIARRVLRALAELGVRAVAVHTPDDAASGHVRDADVALALSRTGAAGYLDGTEILALARAAGVSAVHPGYGFLSEDAGFARACVEAGLTFVGPRADLLDLFGDKGRARRLAAEVGVAVPRGSDGPTSLDEARAFLASLPAGAAMAIKAIAGGGGRGMRVVRPGDDLAAAYERCRSEAQAAFGRGDVYVEEYLPRVRHVEVQIAGDRYGAVGQLGERDCSIQRRHQKVIEVAPAPGLEARLRDAIAEAALAMARHARYDSVGTLEFLVPLDGAPASAPFYFIEANPRLQVEHTVTEEVTGFDLVRVQLALAAGAALSDLDITEARPACNGFAVQARVLCESIDARGQVRPSAGTLAAFDPPLGTGVRVETAAYAGLEVSPRYDSLIAKVISHVPGGSFADAVARTRRALRDFRIEGLDTNLAFLEGVLGHSEFAEGGLYTGFLDDHLPAVLETAQAARRHPEPPPAAKRAQRRVDRDDPLGVLTFRAPAQPAGSGASADAPEGSVACVAPWPGTVLSIEVEIGAPVREGQTVCILEAMKMEHEIAAPASGIVRGVAVEAGDTAHAGEPLLFIDEAEVDDAAAAAGEGIDLDGIRPDLQAVLDRRARIRDDARPQAVAQRRVRGLRTARENVADLCDPGSFVEYGPLVVAAQRARRSMEELIEKSPADGIVAGVGTVNGETFGDERAGTVVLAYDFTVFAGTQGRQSHRKTDRLLDVADRLNLPVVLFAEGGGGRPGETEGFPNDTHTFSAFPKLSGQVPLVGVVTGRCFAGNAVMLGCCDVIIATEGANIGLGGPAMVEGGGLGVFAPEEIGPMSVQVPNGVVDIAVRDEAEAVAVAKRYLSYFQGTVPEWASPDQRLMRHIVPENRLRAYRVRDVISTLADEGSVLELRPQFGAALITSLIRIEGRTVGVLANNPFHLGGAIDADGADKGARFLQLCDAFGIPVVFFMDTPGIMVGPDAERTALARHATRMFVAGANLSVPTFTVILRKAYGLGATAMVGGAWRSPLMVLAWPTGEFGPMGLEGAVKLGYRRELEAIEDPEARRERYRELVAAEYEKGKALNHVPQFPLDDVIDPAETRDLLAKALRSIPETERGKKRRPAIDTW